MDNDNGYEGIKAFLLGLAWQCDAKPRACSEHWAGLAQRINKPFLPIRHMGAMPIITKGLPCMSLQAQGKTIGSTLDMIHFQHIEPTNGKSRCIASKQIHSPYLANAILATAVATVWAVLLTISWNDSSAIFPSMESSTKKHVHFV